MWDMCQKDVLNFPDLKFFSAGFEYDCGKRGYIYQATKATIVTLFCSGVLTVDLNYINFLHVD